MRVFKLKSDDLGTFDAELIDRAERLFYGDDLFHQVLHAHLLLERAMIARIALKMVRPEKFGKDSRWTFAQLINIYIGLYDIDPSYERLLRTINKIRNEIAHGFVNVSEIVEKYIPSEDPGKSGYLTVPMCALIVLQHMGAITAVEIDENFPVTKTIDKKPDEARK